jgi:hypothetical protein
MFDTVHVEIPRGVNYSRHFVPICNDLERRCDEGTGGWKATSGAQPYRRIANLEEYDIAALVHTMPRWGSSSMGDKVELIGAGSMRISDMVRTIRKIYNFDVEEAPLIRVDCTADVKNVPVDWFVRHTRVKYKAKGRGHGKWREENTRTWETFYAGDKPNQLRIYDKLGERLHQLKKLRASLPKSERENVTFESMFGFSPSPLVRVENQMGARSTSKVFGIKVFGQLPDLARKPVFRNIVFPETARRNDAGLTGLDLLAARHLANIADELGLRAAHNEAKRILPARTFWRKWPLFEAFLHSVPETAECQGITLEALTARYHDSCLVQIAA